MMAQRERKPKYSKPKRKTYARVLIVCEDEKTEPAYFKEIINEYKIHHENIDIIGTGKDPKSVVDRAKIEFDNKKIPNKAYIYDYVFCVFDRDSHKTFDSASNTIQNNKDLIAVRSWPCFEYWILLHFNYSSRYFHRTDKSPCDNCIDVLKKDIPDYEKNYGSFSSLMDKLEFAITNAKGSRQRANTDGEPNPSTEVYKILECLKELKKTNRLRSA